MGLVNKPSMSSIQVLNVDHETFDALKKEFEFYSGGADPRSIFIDGTELQDEYKEALSSLLNPDKADEMSIDSGGFMNIYVS